MGTSLSTVGKDGSHFYWMTLLFDISIFGCESHFINLQIEGDRNEQALELWAVACCPQGIIGQNPCKFRRIQISS